VPIDSPKTLLVPQPGQNTSSHGVPASSAARIVGDHNMSRPRASWSFHRWMTVFASARTALSAAAARYYRAGFFVGRAISTAMFFREGAYPAGRNRSSTLTRTAL
jgi:hypothetical protein